MSTDEAAQQESDRDRDLGEETDKVDRNEKGGSKQKSSLSTKSSIHILFLIEVQYSSDTYV